MVHDVRNLWCEVKMNHAEGPKKRGMTPIASVGTNEEHLTLIIVASSYVTLE